MRVSAPCLHAWRSIRSGGLRMKLASPVAAVGLAAIISRLLGYARDVLVANLLGAGPMAEALLAALRTPNALRRTLGEGGLNAALTPIYLRLRMQHGEAHAAAFARTTLALATLALGVLGGLLALGASAVIYLSAPGLESRAEDFELARWWFVLMTPFIGAATLASIAAAFLNAERRYVIAALAPAIVNAALVGTYLAIPLVTDTPRTMGALMALSLSVGGLLQLALVLWPLKPTLRQAASGLQPGVMASIGKALRLGAPALVATASFQIIGIVASAVASQEPAALAWFYYADRLFQLPLSLAGVVLGSVVLTELGARRADDTAIHALPASKMLDHALVYALAIGLPAAVALFVLAEPIIRALFSRGAFSPGDVTGTAMALMAMAPGLPAGVAARVLLQGLLVREQAWASAVCGGAGVLATAVAAVLLTPFWGVVGASAAVTAGLWAQCAAIALTLASRNWWRPSRAILRPLLVQTLAAGIMAAALVVVACAPLLSHGGGVRRLAVLLLICAAGGALYGGVIWLGGGIPGWGFHKQRRGQNPAVSGCDDATAHTEPRDLRGAGPPLHNPGQHP